MKNRVIRKLIKKRNKKTNRGIELNSLSENYPSKGYLRASGSILNQGKIC